MNYDGKIFKPVANSSNGDVNASMHFHYHQKGEILYCSYSGDNIQYGHLIGLVRDDGSIDMRYHQVNALGDLCTGICTSQPETMKNGKVRLIEKWQWTSGDCSSGESILEEV